MPGHPNPHQDELAELALKRVVASGAEYGDIRLLDSTAQTIRGEDRHIASIREIEDRGFGIRVLYHGAWGFAASSVLSLEEVPRVAEGLDEMRATRLCVPEVPYGPDVGVGLFHDTMRNDAARASVLIARHTFILGRT